MHPIVLLWFYIWNILTSFICSSQSFQLTQSKIPYDVVFPPVDKEQPLPPVIMLHGILDWRKTWMNYAPKIANKTGRQVYAYDALNNGDNKWTDDVDFDSLVSELEQFMQDLNISVATLVGHSLGGKTSMKLAVEKPEKVEKLILEDISPRKPTAKVMTYLRNGFMLFKLALELLNYETETDEIATRKLITTFMEKKFSKFQSEASSTEFLMEWIPMTKRGDKFVWLSNIDMFIKILRNKLLEELNKELAGVYQGDAMFIYGSKSLFAVGSDELVKMHFPKATLIEITGASHALHFEFPREFEREVVNFINKK